MEVSVVEEGALFCLELGEGVGVQGVRHELFPERKGPPPSIDLGASHKEQLRWVLSLPHPFEQTESHRKVVLQSLSGRLPGVAY